MIISHDHQPCHHHQAGNHHQASATHCIISPAITIIHAISQHQPQHQAHPMAASSTAWVRLATPSTSRHHQAHPPSPWWSHPPPVRSRPHPPRTGIIRPTPLTLAASSTAHAFWASRFWVAGVSPLASSQFSRFCVRPSLFTCLRRWWHVNRQAGRQADR